MDYTVSRILYTVISFYCKITLELWSSWIQGINVWDHSNSNIHFLIPLNSLDSWVHVLSAMHALLNMMRIFYRWFLANCIIHTAFSYLAFQPYHFATYIWLAAAKLCVFFYPFFICYKKTGTAQSHSQTKMDAPIPRYMKQASHI